MCYVSLYSTFDIKQPGNSSGKGNSIRGSNHRLEFVKLEVQNLSYCKQNLEVYWNKSQIELLSTDKIFTSIVLFSGLSLPFYCNLVWASTYKTDLVGLVILQKRVVRIIAKSCFDAHTDPIFKIS